jgi:peptide/nickel transport system substrate-binding protein
MKATLSRRRLLQSTAAVGALSLLPRRAAAADRDVIVRIERDIQNLDPANRIGTVEGNILKATMRRRTTYKPGVYQIENDAAESIEQVDDTTIAFTLKKGIMFHDGYGEMTAEDVKFSFERFNNPAAGQEPATYAGDWAALDHVEVTDTYSGKLILKNPAPALWLIALSDTSGSIASKKAFEELGDKIKTRVIGTGPYRMSDWQPNRSVTLTADPDFVGDPPPVKEIVLSVIEEPKTAQLAFRSGEVSFTKLDDISAADAMKDVDGTDIIKMDSINYVWIGMNVQKPPLDNLKVRQAIRLALDVDAIILAGWNGAVSRANALMAPGLLGHWAEAPVYTRDVDAAKALLAEAGVEVGKLRLTLLNKPYFQTAALVAQANLAEVGIELELEVLDGGTYWSMGEGDAGKNLDLSIQRFGGKVDPSFQTQWFTTDQIGEWNWQRWSSPEFDKLDKEAAATNDNDKRAADYIRMQQLMDESAAYVWLTHEVNIFATKDWLKPSILANGDDWQYNDFTVQA